MGNYHELIRINSFSERIEYLSLYCRVGEETFGSLRYLNQDVYHSKEWHDFRNRIIVRDNGFNLAHPDYLIEGRIYVHHIDPVTPDDFSKFFDLDNVVCTSFNIHNLIHYGYVNSIDFKPVERYPNDTSPWKLNKKE